MVELSKLIARYLNGELNAQEKKEFEQGLHEDDTLKKELDLHRQLIEGIEMAALGNELLQVRKRYVLKKLAIKVILGLIAAVGTTILVFNLVSGRTKAGNTLPPALKSEQHFTISRYRDTVLETQEGMVFYIPANAFDTEHDSVEISVDEALKASDIMIKGLSTVSDSSMLETAGMFKIKGSSNGISVPLVKKITAHLPTERVDPDMRVFRGKEDKNGNINWVNPEKPELPQLKTYDIRTLNFFPNGYESVIEELYDLKGVNKESKRIYFEMSGWCKLEAQFDKSSRAISGAQRTAIIERPSGFPPGFLIRRVPKGAPENTVFYNEAGIDAKGRWVKILGQYTGEDTQRIVSKVGVVVLGVKQIVYNVRYKGKLPLVLITYQTDTLSSTMLQNEDKPERQGTCEIDPSRIRAIWNTKYNNTILATHEFEERLKYIFTTCNPGLLDLYMMNLNKPMWFIDSMCMLQNAGFRRFYERRTGGVTLKNKRQQVLNKYYQEKYKLFHQAAVASWKAYIKKQKQKDVEFKKRLERSEQIRVAMNNKAFREELEHNIKDVYRQLGKRAPNTKPPSRAMYVVSVRRTGWYNVDKFARRVTQRRVTTQYKDSASGKEAIVRYEPCTVKVENAKSFDLINTYLLPKGFSSFLKMRSEGFGKYSRNLNLSLKNRLVVVAYKDGEWYWQKIHSLTPGVHKVSLNKISEFKLKYELSRYNWKAKVAMQEDFEFDAYKNAYEQDLKKRRLKKREKEKIASVVFSCQNGGLEADSTLVQSPPPVLGGDI